MKYRIFLTLNGFSGLTGSEMYVHDLASELARRGHRVTIASSHVGNAVTESVQAKGVKVFSWADYQPEEYDILHLNQKGPSERALETLHDVPAVATVHSELPIESPDLNTRIRKYIVIRPAIKDRLMNEYNMNENKIVLIYNGIDFNRFNTNYEKPTDTTKRIIFVGTTDSIRRSSIIRTAQKAVSENKELWVVGPKVHDYVDVLPNTKYFEATWDIEKYYKQCHETAGILLGRSTIEGWACGLPGLIYDVDRQGNIKSVELFQPPDDMKKFDIKFMTDEVLKVYKQAML